MSRRAERHYCPVGNCRASDEYIPMLATVVLLQQESKWALHAWTDAILHGHGLSCSSRRHGDSSGPDANDLDFKSKVAAKDRRDFHPVFGRSVGQSTQ